jgi:hypothetical protein
VHDRDPRINERGCENAVGGGPAASWADEASFVVALDGVGALDPTASGRDDDGVRRESFVGDGASRRLKASAMASRIKLI